MSAPTISSMEAAKVFEKALFSCSSVTPMSSFSRRAKHATLCPRSGHKVAWISSALLRIQHPYLSMDNIRHILSYTGTIKMRNGKYMGQISKTDEQYELLRNISRNVVKNLGYLLYVNKNLTIRIIIYRFSTTIVEYEYYFGCSKTPIYYRPK